MIIRATILAFLCACQLTSFAQSAPTNNQPSADALSPLFAQSWNLVELNGVSTMQPGVKQAYITFQRGEFNFNRISGFTGCNYIGGKIDLLDDDGIAFHPEPITNNNCHGSSVEANLMQTLLSADGWSEKMDNCYCNEKEK